MEIYTEVRVISPLSCHFFETGAVMLYCRESQSVNIRFEAGTVHYNFGLHEIEEIK